MNAFTSYLEKLGTNFLVAAMVPSLALVISTILVFDPILDIAHIIKYRHGVLQLVGFGPLVVIVTVIIGFTLSALNTLILKVFEGYSIPFAAHIFYNLSKRKHLSQARKLLADRQTLKSEIRHLEKHTNPSPEQKATLEDMRTRYYKLTADYGLHYPEDLNDILPTRFGNVLKAAENYPGERYGMDGVHFWPRLVHVIHPEYKATIDHTRNELSFLANMSILSFLFSCMCVAAVFVEMSSTQVVLNQPAVFIQFLDQVQSYFIAAAIGLMSFAFFYNASIFAVGSFGFMIRSSYDLFRMELLRKLDLPRPSDSAKEFDTWQRVNELFVLGGNSLTFTKLDYRPDETEE